MTDEQIKMELSSRGVTHVSRFILKKDGKGIKTNTLFLTFDMHVPTAKIKIGYYIMNVQPYSKSTKMFPVPEVWSFQKMVQKSTRLLEVWQRRP